AGCGRNSGRPQKRTTSSSDGRRHLASRAASRKPSEPCRLHHRNVFAAAAAAQSPALVQRCQELLVTLDPVPEPCRLRAGLNVCGCTSAKQSLRDLLMPAEGPIHSWPCRSSILRVGGPLLHPGRVRQRQADGFKVIRAGLRDPLSRWLTGNPRLDWPPGRPPCPHCSRVRGRHLLLLRAQLFDRDRALARLHEVNGAAAAAA
uniref:TRAF-type domain-containing protein n=1 Tax=Macrostomum lignano TaxID=282301 RepID=A0A1I8FQY2_9PLAT